MTQAAASGTNSASVFVLPGFAAGAAAIMTHTLPLSVDTSLEQPRPTRVRFVVVALATLSAIFLYLDRICLSFTERYITQDLGLSSTQASWLLSAFFWTYALAQVPSGWLGDRFGVRNVLAAYIVGWSLFTGLMGVAHSFAALLVFRFGCGLAQAGAYPTSASLLSKWVPFSGRAGASGVVATGGRIGGALAQGLTAYLLLTLGGWRPVMFVYGAAGVLVAFLFWLGVRNRPGLHPGCNAAEVALIEHGRPAGSSTQGAVGGLPLRYLVRSRSLWLSSISQFGTNFGWVFVITWFPRFLLEVYQVPVLERGWMTSLPLLVSMAGMLAGGWVTDWLTKPLGLRWGRALPMGLTRFVCAAAFVACLGSDSAWGVTIALCVMTISTDLGVPAVWAFKQDVGGRHVGSVLGWGNMWGNLGAAVSPVVLNEMVELGGWNACFLTCAAAFLLSGVAALGVDARIPIVPVSRPAEPGTPL